MGPIGVQEMILIFILALLLFGPKKLPELARMLGKGLSEFRRAKNELQSTFNTHMQELEREARAEDAKRAELPNPASSAPKTTPYAYAADEYGQASAGYGQDFSSSSSSYPSEPPVESHSNGTDHQQAAAPVPDAVPRSNGTYSVAHTAEIKDEHPA